MTLTMLGTGNALVTECYNTCFALGEGGEYFLVDGGGGNALLTQLKRAGIDWRAIRTIFVTHKHIDHLLGIVWMLRMICQNMSAGKYDGDVTLYAHGELVQTIHDIARMLLQEKETRWIGTRVRLVPVQDGEEKTILGYRTAFFDIQSTKAKQFGFTLYLEGGEKLTCCGDEPYHEHARPYVEGSAWLLHEAFCLYSQADRFGPYEKHHATVREACELAERMGVKNLLLYHTEDANIQNRKALYTAEGADYFSGNLYVPDDLEVLEL